MSATRRSRLFAVIPCLAALGCSGFHRKPLDPGAELLALRSRGGLEWIVELRKPGDSSSTEPRGASSSAFDPSDGLDEAEVVTVALLLNPEIRARRLEAGEAGSALIQAGLWPNPEIGFAWRDGLDASGSMLEADFLVDLLSPFVRSAARAAGRARAEAVEAGIVADEWGLVARARHAHLDVLFAEGSLSAREEETRVRRKVLDRVKAALAAGERTDLDVALAELDAAEAARSEREARASLAAARRSLNGILGLPSSHPLELRASGEPLTVAVFEDVEDHELDRRLLAGRFELREKEAEYREAEEELRRAVLEQIPGLRAGPSWERELDGADTLGIGIGLEVPIFDRNQGEIAEREIRRERLRAEYSALLHRLMADAEGARDRLRRAKVELEVQDRELLPALRRAEDLAESAFEARELSLVEWAAARERAIRTRVARLGALLEYQKAVIDLEAALGAPLAGPPPNTIERKEP